jgi:cytochrome c553
MIAALQVAPAGLAAPSTGSNAPAMSGGMNMQGMGSMRGVEGMDTMDGMDSMDGMSMQGDAKRGARIASTNCGACHGATGHSLSDELPNLAGRRAMYLMSSLMAYRSGKRNVPTMTAIASKLSGQEMADVAAYYSGLENDP